MQNVNCAKALTLYASNRMRPFNNPQSWHWPAYDYAASPEYKTLAPYINSAGMFTNPKSAHCGPFTSCIIKPGNCRGTYSGNARIEEGTLGLQARTNVD